MEQLNQIEAELLKVAMLNPTEYRFKIDSGSIWLEGKGLDGYYDHAYTFDDYGSDFIVKLLNTIGYNAEHC